MTDSNNKGDNKIKPTIRKIYYHQTDIDLIYNKQRDAIPSMEGYEKQRLEGLCELLSHFGQTTNENEYFAEEAGEDYYIAKIRGTP